MKKALCLTAVLLLAGGARAADVTANDLKQIGLAYHNMNDATNKAPAKAKDLAPYFENSKKLLNFLESGQIVFLYNVRLQQILGGAGTSNTVLAYVKEAPTKGGLVLMADGSVKKMTADEFKKAPKAGKK
jgi:hypothetical protein